MTKKEMQLYIDDLENNLEKCNDRIYDLNSEHKTLKEEFVKVAFDGALALFKHMCPAKYQIGDEIGVCLVLDAKPVKTPQRRVNSNILTGLINFIEKAFPKLTNPQRLNIEHEIEKYDWEYRIFDKNLKVENDISERELEIIAAQEEMSPKLSENQHGLANKMQHVEYIAAICHEANRAYCKGIGDNSQPSWNDAPDWQKNSAVDGVKFHIENPKAGAEGSHNNWMKQKEADGWKYGAVKDPEKKEHPCMVSYNKLPAEQQIKDSIFIGLVHSLYFESGLAEKAEPVFQKVVKTLEK